MKAIVIAIAATLPLAALAQQAAPARAEAGFQQRVHERYWREGQELKVTVTVEDAMFLKQPASYTTRWVPQRPGYKLSAWDCDPEASRAPVKMMPQKYKD